jgi:hypothetical protein
MPLGKREMLGARDPEGSRGGEVAIQQSSMCMLSTSEHKRGEGEMFRVDRARAPVVPELQKAISDQNVSLFLVAEGRVRMRKDREGEEA